MAGPWEKYQQPAAQGAGRPWEKFAPQVPEGMVFNPRTGGYADMAAAAERTLDRSPAQGVRAEFLQGVPFVGSYADEISGALSGPLQQEYERQLSKQYQERSPNAAMAARLGGGVVGTVATLPALGAAPAMAGATMPARVAAGAGAGLAAGATEGAIYGYGAGEGDGRLGESGRQAALGAGLGTAVGAAMPLVAAGARGVANWAMDRPNAAALRNYGVTPESAAIMQRSIAGDDPRRAIQNIRAAGPDAMIADAGPGTVSLLDAAIQTPSGARIGREAVDARAASARQRVVDALDASLGPAQGPRATARGIADSTRAGRQTAYDAAYNTAIDYASDAGRRVEDVLGRIPPNELRAAIEEANADMLAQGLRNQQVMAQIGQDGAVSFREMPNVRQVDAIKRALDARATRDMFGRITAEGRRPQMLSRQLRDALADAVPAYREALDAGADKIAQDQGLQLGRSLLSTATTPEMVSEAVQGASQAELAAMRSGLRSHIEDAMANVSRAMTDPNMDAREAAKAFRDMSSRAAREKVRLVLGDEAADGLFAQLDQASRSVDLRAMVAQNSKTAPRLEAARAVDELVVGGPMRQVARGDIGASTRDLVQYITGQTKQADQALKDQIYADLARVLTQRRGAQAEQAMVAILQALANRQTNPARAAQAGRAAVAAALTGGVPAAQQGLGIR